MSQQKFQNLSTSFCYILIGLRYLKSVWLTGTIQKLTSIYNNIISWPNCILYISFQYHSILSVRLSVLACVHISYQSIVWMDGEMFNIYTILLLLLYMCIKGWLLLAFKLNINWNHLQLKLNVIFCCVCCCSYFISILELTIWSLVRH